MIQGSKPKRSKPKGSRCQGLLVGYDRKVLLETGTGYRIFKILIPFYIAGTGNLRLLSVSGLSGTGFFIPDSVSGRNRIKELTGIPAGILKDLYTL